jgi:hypothetical protein
MTASDPIAPALRYARRKLEDLSYVRICSSVLRALWASRGSRRRTDNA